jgi:hypothetical protein
MGEVKSAFERAMERAERLGNESAQEREARQREAVRAQAEGLARRYLAILSYDSRDLERDLGKLEGGVQEQVAPVVLRLILDAVGPLADDERLLRGIRAAGGDEAKIEELRRLGAEFVQTLEERRRSLEETSGRSQVEELRGLGISGSAVCFEVESSWEWRQAAAGLAAEFDRRRKELFG